MDDRPPRLFLPGPTEVAPEILQEMARPALGHRTEECARLWAACRAGLRWLTRSHGEVLILTGPATAMMEAAIRNCVERRVLHLVCGAFSQRWREVSEACGREADALEVPWGRGFRAAEVARALAEARAEGRPYEAVALVHNETSTGVVNPLQEIAEVVRAEPGTLLLVDTVSSMGGLPVEVEAWGLDVCLFGMQKCLALPAGLAVAAVSEAALEKAGRVRHRGWLLDFLRLREANRKEQSPTTPSTAHLYALAAQLRRIREEGLEARWERHRALAERTRAWAREKGFRPFPEEGFRSDTVSCLERGDGPDFRPALARLREKGWLISGGYGPLKDRSFRIGHLGDHRMEDLEALLAAFDEALEETAAAGAGGGA